jgi:hypothetical protein
MNRERAETYLRILAEAELGHSERNGQRHGGRAT